MKWSNSNSQNLPSQLIYALDYSWSEFNFLGQIKTYGALKKMSTSYGMVYRLTFKYDSCVTRNQTNANYL